jgi:peroxiredoxin/uncharacterized membrane protein YphA (DoxX/SURF4 family)
MSIALLIARLLLAAVFVVAGLAKLADLAGSRQALRDFGVPAVLATPLGILLPLGELTVALALLPLITAWWGALGALVLLLLFVVGIGYNLARGRRPDCHCFGQLHSAPAGWPTLIRNLLLAAIASLVVSFGRANPGPSPLDWLAGLAIMQRLELLFGAVVLILLALLGWVLLHVLQQQGRLLVRIEALEARLAAHGQTPQPDTAGLSLGSSAPAFTLSDLKGERLTLEALRAAGKPIVLVFSDPGCGPCTALLPEIGRWQREYAKRVTLALISRGSLEVNRSKASEHGITTILLQQDREVAEAYQAHGNPTAVLVRPDGTIGGALAAGADAIRALVARAVGLPVLSALPMATPPSGNGRAGIAPSPQPARLKIGEPAPEFTLPDLTGKPVKLGDFRGSKTLLLFWNPGCGFCQRMLEDLKAWEARPQRGAPRVLVVSTGTVEANQALGLNSTVVLDEGFTVAPKFGATGTPMAVLVDAEGNIASELAAGAPAVLALAGQKQDNAAHV